MNQFNFNFKDLDNITHIAGALGCELSFVQFVLDYPASFYHQLCVPRKRRSEPRIVYEVNDDLKNLHTNILTCIAAKVKFPVYVQGFVSKRPIVTNASLHLGHKYVLNLDIKDFFDSIKIKKVASVFEELGCNHEVAFIFAQLCTLNGCLVQGANTSPILANLVCIELDKELVLICQEYDCVYSRYADDITFSGEKVPTKKSISQCLEKYDFKLNPDKWKWQCRGKAQYVTGLTVFDEEIPRLPKQMKRHLRQELYYAYKHGLPEHLEKSGIQDSRGTYINKIDGLIAFMYSVEPNRAYQFDTIWQRIRAREGLLQSRDPAKIFKKWGQQSLSYPSLKEQGIQQVNTSNQLH